MKILILTRYEPLGASSRLRMLQYLPVLKKMCIEFEVHPLITDEMLKNKYEIGKYAFGELGAAYFKRILVLLSCNRFDLVWIEKEALPWMPVWLEILLLSRASYVLDYDDAWFHNYDMHRLSVVRKLFGQRLDKLINKSRLFIGGNDYLLNRAVKAEAKWVERLSTVIDIERYPAIKKSRSDGGVPIIVWIGSPSTVRYLSELSQPLSELAKKYQFKLRVIGAEITMPGVVIECIKWTEATEVAAISECDIGVMPLIDSPWERGKCGYKLIQYMACSLPVVASPVGVNTEIVQEGHNGFLASTTQEWVHALRLLLTDQDLRSKMGKDGRSRVETTYCLQVSGPHLVNLLIKAAK